MKRSGKANPFSIPGSDKYNQYFVGPSSRGKWFEVDSVGQDKNNIKNQSLGLLISSKVISWWLVILLAGVSILFFRSAYLQIFQGAYLSSVAEGNRIRVLDIKASRGVIYDRNGDLLVENIAGFSLAIVPVDFEKDPAQQREIAAELASISTKSADEIFDIIQDQSVYSYQPVVIQENLTQDQAIMAKILASRFPGVILKVDNIRNYLTPANQSSLSHVLGYLGKIEDSQLANYLDQGYAIDDFVGKAGVELSYESQLKGVNGRQQVEVDASGEAKEVLAYQVPLPGKNLVLTIDAELQAQAEKSLARVLRANAKTKGAVVVLDPNSGQVLALVNLPSFDNNSFSQGISPADLADLLNDPSQPLFSRAISGEYPSGSIFKLVVGAAALEEGLITPSTNFNSVGGIQVSRWFFPDWKAGGHGWTNITKAIAQSVNTFFYTIGGGYKDFEGLGVARIHQYAKQFGLNQKLGIDLPNEADGFLPSQAWKESVKQERWYIGDTYNLSIGQGDVLVTPLQVAVWTSVFANGGTLYQPQVVKQVLDSEDNLISEIQPKVLNQNFIKPENISAINLGLRQAVLTGSATRLYDLPISVAAKTGTAQWSSIRPPHGWLTAFAPYRNPEIVVTVLVEEGIGGVTTALPVAYDILNWWANNR